MKVSNASSWFLLYGHITMFHQQNIKYTNFLHCLSCSHKFLLCCLHVTVIFLLLKLFPQFSSTHSLFFQSYLPLNRHVSTIFFHRLTMFPQCSSIQSLYATNSLPPSRHFLAQYFHPVIVFPLFMPEATNVGAEQFAFLLRVRQRPS